MNRTDVESVPSVRGRRRTWLFRAAAVLFGLCLLGLVEGTLVVLGVARPDYSEDPFVGFSDVQPLFVPDGSGNAFEIPQARLTHFRPQLFPRKKPEGQIRIFVLGGSTVQGRPYAVETSLTTWLEVALNAADETREFDVINCGGISYASYRLVPILEECLEYEPDLFIVCTGQNEFLEDRTYADVKEAAGPFHWAHTRLSRLRTYAVLQKVVKGNAVAAADRSELPAEADALLDWKYGMDAYQRDPKWQSDVVVHYRVNLERMVAIADEADVPLVFLTPVSNLDWAPFKAAHREGITSEESERFNVLWDAAVERYDDDLETAFDLLQQAREIDERHAGLLFAIGQTAKGLKRFDVAREFLVRAKEEDICPLRMLESMREDLGEVAAETGTPLVEVDTELAARSPGGILGDQWLVDHVHPTIEGHQLIGLRLLEAVAAQGFVTPVADWESRARKEFAAHLDSIDQVYFVKGQYRNETVQRWARGMAEDERPAAKAD